MATFEFKLPDIGEGVTEGEIVEWFVKPGDRVNEDDPMVEVMTDKATVTIGAPRDGVIEDLRVAVGKVARVGQVILTLVMQPGSLRPSQPAATAVGDIQEGLPGANFFQQASGNGRSEEVALRPASAAKKKKLRTSVPPPPMEIDYFQAKPLATPATRRLAKELGVDLRRVRPSGKNGRVSVDDIRAAAVPSALQPQIQSSEPDREERIPIVGMRRVIAERMTQSKDTAAHFTFVEECDVGQLLEARRQLRVEAERHNIEFNFLPFVIKAVIGALQEFPALNSSVDDANGEIVVKNYFNIGIATSTEAGLMVPVIRNADKLNLLELAAEISRLASGAREGSLTRDELSGSTFTVTSLGKQGGLFATPILNYPEVGILGVHQIKERPVVRDGQIEIGNIMLLSLSFDHRVVDGHVAAAFAYAVIDLLEHPIRLLSV